MNVPDFFIIGAPKCGTTSLYMWLSGHPNIFMPQQKEPHYFNDDHRQRNIECEHEYLALYRDRQPDHMAIGESSAWYFYSRNAVTNILAYNRNARFIVCLRNPIDMALSLHGELLFSGYETLRNFDDAWAAQAERARGRGIPWLCPEPAFLQYGAVCSLGSQLRRLCEIAPRKAIVTIVLDDVVRDARAQYRRVLEFLGLADDGRDSFAAANVAKERRSCVLARAIEAGAAVKRALGITARLSIVDRIEQANRKPKPRPKIATEVRKKLAGYFAGDVALLSKLLSRDLSHWLQSA